MGGRPGKRPPAGNTAAVLYSTDRLTGLLGSGMTVRFTVKPGMGFWFREPSNTSL